MHKEKGSQRCRRLRPRENGDPEWLERWREEVEALQSEENTDAYSDSDTPDAAVSEADAAGAAVAAATTPAVTTRDDNMRNERRINMLRGRPAAPDQPDQPTGYDDMIMLQPNQNRREGRRRARQHGRRQQRQLGRRGRRMLTVSGSTQMEEGSVSDESRESDA